tara:strand:- start:5727 stop:6923 length:1197 start_codon:yes stop_codon:yes gene_type:complete
MSIFFREKNKEGARDLFEKKVAYQIRTKSEYPNLIDFQFAEKALYGRVDRLYLPIVPNSYYAELKKIPVAAGETNKNVIALGFVVDMFMVLKNQFLKKAQRQEISTDERFLSNIVAHKGYQNPKKMHNEHIGAYLSTFEELVKNQNIKFLNFDHFVEKLFPYLQKTIRKIPFTFPAFVKSTYCPIHASGLVIEIANDADHADDVEKMNIFYNSANWEFYLNACNNLGFMVDRNNPWRLVADVASGEMVQAAAAYGLKSTDEILNIGYDKAHAKDSFSRFKVIMYNMYRKLKKKRFTNLVTVRSGGERIVTRRPVEYSYQQFIEEKDDAYFLNLYCKIRFVEEESRFTAGEQERIIDNVIELSNFNLKLSIDSFEQILNKTFDYNGSLSYINNALTKTR